MFTDMQDWTDIRRAVLVQGASKRAVSAPAPCRPCAEPVHPHARGDLFSARASASAMTGPSPRAWGSRGPTPATRGMSRSIPHARGDLDSTSRPAAPTCTHSPRAWGSRRFAGPTRSSSRSIPTRVGISSGSGRRRCAPAVHPHARGDLVPFVVVVEVAPGPSPRAWRSLERRLAPGDGFRSIPTRVGISTARRTISPATTVHPHARGDLVASAASSRPTIGPSPRAWGSRL